MGYVITASQNTHYANLRTEKKIDMLIRSKDTTFQNLNFPPICFGINFVLWDI